MSFEIRRQSIHVDSKTRIIIDLAEDIMFYDMKDGLDPTVVVRITVMDSSKPDWKERELCTYIKDFGDNVSRSHFDNFLKKFLKDKEYRKQYLVEETNNKGETISGWEGSYDFDTYAKHEKQVNGKGNKTEGSASFRMDKRCVEAIRELNNRKNSLLRFKDFADLKTFGMDDFSKAKRYVLEGIISENEVRKLQKEFLPEKDVCKEDERLYINALR